MAGADRPDIGQPMAWQRENRRDMPGPEGARLFQRIEQAERRAFGGKRAVYRQAFLILQSENVGGRPLLEEGPELTQSCPLDGDAGSHAMAAALDDEPGIGSFAHQPAKVETRHGTTGARAGAVGVESDSECRPPCVILQP